MARGDRHPVFSSRGPTSLRRRRLLRSSPTSPPPAPTPRRGRHSIFSSRGIGEEDDLDLRWETATGDRVSEVVFLSSHTAVSNYLALTVHPIGVPHLREGESPSEGGWPGWVTLPSPQFRPCLGCCGGSLSTAGLCRSSRLRWKAVTMDW